MGLVIGILLLMGVGCSSLESIDKSRLNHPAMDLTKNKTPSQASYLTSLGSLTNSSSGGSCSVCAH